MDSKLKNMIDICNSKLSFKAMEVRLETVLKMEPNFYNY
jgi:hypothetical protein